MAFNSANFSPIDSAGGYIGLPTNPIYGWKYSTSDNISDVTSSGYFDAIADHGSVRAGDIIGLEANDGNAILYVAGVSLAIGGGIQVGDITSSLWP